MIRKEITELNEIVGIYEVHIEGLERKLKVKVLKMEDGRYYGAANLQVQGKNCGAPYRSLVIQQTKQKALEDAISGFFAFWDPIDAEVTEVDGW